MKIKVCQCTTKELPELQRVECGTTEKKTNGAKSRHSTEEPHVWDTSGLPFLHGVEGKSIFYGRENVRNHPRYELELRHGPCCLLAQATEGQHHKKRSCIRKDNSMN
jgi:hypothetical protein